MATSTPNMNLILPTIGTDSGLQWEQALNANSLLLDAHNHSPGSGTQISPDGLNISSDLAINGNNVTLLRAVRFTAQGSPLSGASDLGCLYVSGADLYYNDENGNQIQITSGGSVNATSSGISSGTATASFSSSVLVVNSASNTPTNIKAASLLMGNTGVSSSHYLTLNPPAAMGSDFSLTLPSIPAQTNIMSLDTSGNIAASINVDNSTIQLSTNVLSVKDGGITNPKLAALGQQVSGTVSSYTTSSTTEVAVTGLTVTITTTGRPVFVGIQSTGSGNNPATFGMLGAIGSVRLQIWRDGSSANTIANYGTIANSTSTFSVPACIWGVDTGATAGSHTYAAYIATTNGSATAFVNLCKMIAYEL